MRCVKRNPWIKYDKWSQKLHRKYDVFSIAVILAQTSSDCSKALQIYWNAFKAIWGCLSQDYSSGTDVIFRMSFLWSFIILNLRVSVHTTHSQTFHLYNNLGKISMYQAKLWRADLNSGILSYDQKCHAFSRICRGFERLTLAPLSPGIIL